MHDGIELAFEGARHRIDLRRSPAASVMVYGQTEVTRDLMEARAAAGAATVYEARGCLAARFRRRRPGHVRQGRRTHDVACDFIAGCDGFHGVCRAQRPAGRAHDLRARLSLRLARRAVDAPPVAA